MDECTNPANPQPSLPLQVFRVSIFIPIVGIVGMLFFGYLLLSAHGLIRWPIPRQTVSLEESAWNEDLLFSVFLIGSAFLLSLRRMKVSLTTDGLEYRSVLRRQRIRWSDVLFVRFRPKSLGIAIRTASELVSMPVEFSDAGRLRQIIEESTRRNAPNAVIEHGHPPFWPGSRLKNNNG